MEEVLNLCEPNFFVEDQTLFIVHFLNNFTDKKHNKKTMPMAYNIYRC